MKIFYPSQFSQYSQLGFVKSENTQNTVPCCQKYTPTDCDFAHWVESTYLT